MPNSSTLNNGNKLPPLGPASIMRPAVLVGEGPGSQLECLFFPLPTPIQFSLGSSGNPPSKRVSRRKIPDPLETSSFPGRCNHVGSCLWAVIQARTGVCWVASFVPEPNKGKVGDTRL